MLQRYQPQPGFNMLSQQWKRASNTKRQCFSRDAAKIIWQFKIQTKANKNLMQLSKGYLSACWLQNHLYFNWENVWQGIHRKGQKSLQLEITLFIEVALWIICCVKRHLHARTQPWSLQQLSLGSACAGLMAGVFLCTVSGNQVKLSQSNV